MGAPIHSDVVLVVMLGAAIWSSLQLSQLSNSPSLRLPALLLARVTVSEGLVCGFVWSIVTLLSAPTFSAASVVQGIAIGCIWAGFSFIARFPFQSMAQVTE